VQCFDNNLKKKLKSTEQNKNNCIRSISVRLHIRDYVEAGQRLKCSSSFAAFQLNVYKVAEHKRSVRR